MLNRLFKNNRSYQFEVAICCIVKDEDRYLPEWIAYHQQIGVSHFYVYDNGSAIPLQETLKEYFQQGLVQVTEFLGKGVQVKAYQHFLDNYKQQCKWVAFIDIDEFIVPKATFGNLPMFLKEFEDYGALGVNWLLFGSENHKARPQGSVTESFLKRSLKTHPMNDHIKSIVQTRFVKSATTDPHHFNFFSKKKCVNENHTVIKGPFSKNSTNKIQINHYINRSLEEYQEKIGRGRADSETIQRAIDHFYEVDSYANLIIDESIKEIKLITQEQTEGTTGTLLKT